MMRAICGLMAWLLPCAVAIVAGGCLSVRTTTDFLPESDPALTSSAGQFYVAGLKYKRSDEAASSAIQSISAAYQGRLLPLVRQECLSRFPLLFAQDSTQAMPIWIEVNDTCEQHNGKLMVWMLGTLTIAPLILPAPMFDIDRDIGVTVGLWNGGDGMVSAAVQKNFRREEHAWGTIFTPIGLITIPGKADFPKASEAFNFGPFGYNDVPQVAQQVATATAKLVAAKDAAYWTSQPRERAIPGVITPAGDVPTALPPPAALPTPF